MALKLHFHLQVYDCIVDVALQYRLRFRTSLTAKTLRRNAVTDPEMKKWGGGHTSVGEQLSARYALCEGGSGSTPGIFFPFWSSEIDSGAI